MFKGFFQTGIRGSYNVSENPSFVSEPWYVYPAKHKSNGRIVSVFIFDKSKFEAMVTRLCSTSSSSKNPKIIISESYELIKFEVNQLSKLKHPQILQIYEVLEETKSKFIFVSEPLTDNLLTASNLSKDELNIQKGLLQVSKGLQFLHNYCSIIHFNLQPSSIYINNQGDWKLGGFKFLQNLNEISPQERDNFYIMNNSSLIPFVNLNMNFTAPELIIDSQSKLDFGNDIWSLGCIIYYLYNDGDQLINCFDSNSINDYKGEFQKFQQKFYNHKVNELKYLLKKIPESLYPIYPQLLARYPHDRLTIDQFIDSNYFNGSLIKAMWFIDEFSTKTLEEKLLFMNGLLDPNNELGKDLLSQFPASFKSSKLLPLLIDLLVNELNVLTGPVIETDTDQLITISLNIILKIGSSISSLTFQDKIFGTLFKDDKKNKKAPETYSKLIKASVKTRLTLVENLSILQDKLHDNQIVDFYKNILDLVLTSAPAEQSQKQDQIKLQETYLKYLTNIIEKIEFPYIKNTLFPMLCQVFKTTTILSTKLVTIEVFEMLVDKKIIDKIIVNDQLFPILKNLKSRDKRIVRSMLSFFIKLIRSEHVNLDFEASVESILPQCLSLSFSCNDCSQDEFKEFMKVCNSIQKHLIEKRLATLPVNVPNSTRVNGNSFDGNFESLINSQTINDGSKDNIYKGPSSATTLTPKVLTPTVKSSPPHKNNTTIAHKTTPLNLKNAAATTSPTNRYSSLNNNQSNVPALKFGASSPSTNVNNTRMLNTLNSTFDKPKYTRNNNTTRNNNGYHDADDDDDDEFEDFQQARITPSTRPTINLSKELPSKPNTNGFPQTPLKPNVGNAINNNRIVTPPTKYPPGFNSNMVLTPNSSGSRNSSNTTSSHIQGQKSNNNNDVLDFL
ncbi:kinase-like domain-containing protein [Scheffersomyces coipomensis]|uniref:kinase-like domain-containing protein n=1 Tax=Scheffersomyces coipomensis TaxID=1788519 RepID=UPI00315D662E